MRICLPIFFSRSISTQTTFPFNSLTSFLFDYHISVWVFSPIFRHISIQTRRTTISFNFGDRRQTHFVLFVLWRVADVDELRSGRLASIRRSQWEEDIAFAAVVWASSHDAVADLDGTVAADGDTDGDIDCDDSIKSLQWKVPVIRRAFHYSSLRIQATSIQSAGGVQMAGSCWQNFSFSQFSYFGEVFQRLNS